MDYRISRHAEEQLIVRDIGRALLDRVMQNPEQKIESDGRMIYQSKVQMFGITYLLRAIVDENGIPPLVVTVYRTTKIERYWKAE